MLDVSTLPFEGDTLSYEETGDGPPLVFVHGAWSSAEAWRPQIEAFAEDYRVITLDVRGHGKTGSTDRNPYSIDLFADDLERLLEHLDVERPLLCGLSLGNLIVQVYLDRYPDRAAGAILAGPVRSIPAVDLPTGMKPFISPIPALSLSLSTVGSVGTFRSLLATIRAGMGRPWLAIDPTVHSRAVDVVRDVPPSEFLKVFAAMYRFVPPTLNHVSTPTLVIYGEAESPLVKRQGEELAAALRDGTVVSIPDAGHMVNADNPEAFNDSCRTFLERTKAVA